MKFKVFALIIIASLFIGFKVHAQIPGCNVAPFYVPDACPSPYIPGKAAGYTADLNCQLKRITNPQNPGCCINKCVDADGEDTGSVTSAENPAVFTNLEVFGTTIKINPNNIGTIINILFTTVLGLVSIYAIARGIYVTGVKRPMATTPDQIAEINKELTNLIIGVIISWGFIIVIQVVANLLGVGQLNNLDISGGAEGGTVITIN
jgi:hypothetical protein